MSSKFWGIVGKAFWVSTNPHNIKKWTKYFQTYSTLCLPVSERPLPLNCWQAGTFCWMPVTHGPFELTFGHSPKRCMKWDLRGTLASQRKPEQRVLKILFLSYLDSFRGLPITIETIVFSLFQWFIAKLSPKFFREIFRRAHLHEFSLGPEITFLAKWIFSGFSEVCPSKQFHSWRVSEQLSKGFIVVTPDKTSMTKSHIFLKALLHNVGALIVSFAVAFIGLVLGLFLRLPGFFSIFSFVAGLPLFGIGFWLRMWATVCFYERGMKVISTAPQTTLISRGPYRFTRNPLYLGTFLYD